MKKAAYILGLTLVLSSAATAQCDSIRPQEMNHVCRAIRTMINYHVRSHHYDKVLTLVLAYDVFNSNCTVPGEFKNYFEGIKEQHAASLNKVIISGLAGNRTVATVPPAQPRQFQSRPPKDLDEPISSRQ